MGESLMTIARIVAGRDQQIVHCSAKETVREAAQMLADRRIGALPVLDRGMVAGIFSERDLLYCVAKHGDGALGLTVGDVMTAPAITVDSATTVHDALELMTRRRIRHLPVVEGGRLVAFVSIGDLVKYRIELVEHEAEAMREYIRSA
jgi:CBS domain-containing protein